MRSKFVRRFKRLGRPVTKVVVLAFALTAIASAATHLIAVRAPGNVSAAAIERTLDSSDRASLPIYPTLPPELRPTEADVETPIATY